MRMVNVKEDGCVNTDGMQSTEWLSLGTDVTMQLWETSGPMDMQLVWQGSVVAIYSWQEHPTTTKQWTLACLKEITATSLTVVRQR